MDGDMKRRTFKQERLWRDGIVKKVQKEGAILHIKTLSDKEFDDALRRKLCEEGREVVHASQAELAEELGDVLEVIYLLCELHGIDTAELEKKRQDKRADRGSYTGRQYVTAVEYPEGSYGAQCCLAEPEEYPEID